MEKPLIKDKDVLKYVTYLEEKIEKYEKSPYKKSYLSLKKQVDSWNEQLTNNNIDLFGDSSEKAFDRAHKFFSEQKPYFEQMEYLRGLMTKSEVEEVDKKLVAGSSAEAHIFKAKR